MRAAWHGSRVLHIRSLAQAMMHLLCSPQRSGAPHAIVLPGLTAARQIQVTASRKLHEHKASLPMQGLRSMTASCTAHSIKMLGLSSITKLCTLFRGDCASLPPPSSSRCSFSDKFSSCSCDSSHISLGTILTLQNTCTESWKRPLWLS